MASGFRTRRSRNACGHETRCTGDRFRGRFPTRAGQGESTSCAVSTPQAPSGVGRTRRSRPNSRAKQRRERLSQLCLYSDLLTEVQGAMPENMYVVVPWSGFEPQRYRFADYAAYYRKVKQSLRFAMSNGGLEDTYPDPKEHCDICRWREVCDGAAGTTITSVSSRASRTPDSMN